MEPNSTYPLAIPPLLAPGTSTATAPLTQLDGCARCATSTTGCGRSSSGGECRGHPNPTCPASLPSLLPKTWPRLLRLSGAAAPDPFSWASIAPDATHLSYPRNPPAPHNPCPASYRLDPAALQLLPEVSHDVFEALAEEPIPVRLPPRDPVRGLAMRIARMAAVYVWSGLARPQAPAVGEVVVGQDLAHSVEVSTGWCVVNQGAAQAQATKSGGAARAGRGHWQATGRPARPSIPG